MPDSPRIFYFCYDHQKPTGGQKQFYRHVDLLNAAGREAYALHVQAGFRLDWFENATPVVSFDQFQGIFDPSRDFLALPEDLGERVGSFPGRKVIINQGVYYGFNVLGLNKPAVYPCLHPEVEAVIVKSTDNETYLRFAYPGIRVLRVMDSINQDIFQFRPVHQKEKLIACIPSKNATDLAQVFHLLHSRAEQGINRLDGFQWAFIQDKSEREVADILNRALFFVFLSTREGFGNLPLEAMFSGCLVTAYRAGPLKEYIQSDNSLPADPGDIISIVRNIELTVELLRRNTGGPRLISEAAHRTASRYSLANQKTDLLRAWNAILASAPRRP